jgi:hypothetical protein
MIAFLPVWFFAGSSSFLCQRRHQQLRKARVYMAPSLPVAGYT